MVSGLRNVRQSPAIILVAAVITLLFLPVTVSSNNDADLQSESFLAQAQGQGTGNLSSTTTGNLSSTTTGNIKTQEWKGGSIQVSINTKGSYTTQEICSGHAFEFQNTVNKAYTFKGQFQLKNRPDTLTYDISGEGSSNAFSTEKQHFPAEVEDECNRTYTTESTSTSFLSGSLNGRVNADSRNVLISIGSDDMKGQGKGSETLYFTRLYCAVLGFKPGDTIRDDGSGITGVCEGEHTIETPNYYTESPSCHYAGPIKKSGIYEMEETAYSLGNVPITKRCVITLGAAQAAPDLVRPTLVWNNIQGGLNLYYSVEDHELDQAATIDVHWARGPQYENRIGNVIFRHVVPAGTAPGQYGPIHIVGGLLANNPAGVTHLIASSSPTMVGAVVDVRVDFGPNANANVVWAATMDIIKDGLRAAGQSLATITSTARTPADQARAMFNNLVNPANPIAVNVDRQMNGFGNFPGYGPHGDAVILVFVAEIQGMNYQQIIQNQAAIRAAMEQEINNRGCPNVTRHCANPAELNVVDIGSAAFNANNGPLFVNSIQGRVDRFFDERNINGAYHLEVRLH